MIFFGVDNKKIVVDVMGVLCLKVGKDFGLIDESKWVLLWVIDFLMFEDDGEGGLMVMYYLFILLKDMIVVELKVVLENVVVNVYDMVINGYEVGGGLVCIYNGDMQQMVFGILGINEEEQCEKFGFLFDVLKYGILLYVGLVFGFDCLIMLLIGIDNICDVIVFLKIMVVVCLMIEVLSFVNLIVLVELSIQVVKKVENN